MSVDRKSRSAASRSNFYFSFLFLPGDQREAIERVYRFCRTIDDVVDEERPLAEKRALIDGWRTELERCYSGEPVHPAARTLLDPIRRFGLSREFFEGVINGVEMDLTVARYDTFEALSRYIYGVAGCVGLLCLQIFGVSLSRYRDYAVSLGTAFQLTNILRDLKSDAGRGRIYLPLEDLRRSGYADDDLLRSVYNDAFLELMDFQYRRARSFFDRARGMVQPGDRRRLVAAEIMSSIYAALLERMRRDRYPVFDRTIVLPAHRKFFIAFRSRIGAGLPRFNAVR